MVEWKACCKQAQVVTLYDSISDLEACLPSHERQLPVGWLCAPVEPTWDSLNSYLKPTGVLTVEHSGKSLSDFSRKQLRFQFHVVTIFHNAEYILTRNLNIPQQDALGIGAESLTFHFLLGCCWDHGLCVKPSSPRHADIEGGSASCILIRRSATLRWRQLHSVQLLLSKWVVADFSLDSLGFFAS